MTSDSPHPAFVPVRLRCRRDGWTAERQTGFIAALHATGNVREACRAVGKSPEAAYKLRRLAGAESFRAAWDAAFGVRPAAAAQAAPQACQASTSGRQWHVSALQASSTSTAPAPNPSTSAPAPPARPAAAASAPAPRAIPAPVLEALLRLPIRSSPKPRGGGGR
jgi:hypothetical protein